MLSIRTMPYSMMFALLWSCGTESSQLDQFGVREHRRVENERLEREKDDNRQIAALLEEHHFTIEKRERIKDLAETRQRIQEFFASETGAKIARIASDMRINLNQPPTVISQHIMAADPTVMAERLDTAMFERRMEIYQENYFRDLKLVPISKNWWRKMYQDFTVKDRMEHFETWVGENRGFDKEALKYLLTNTDSRRIMQLIDTYRLLPEELRRDVVHRTNFHSLADAVPYRGWSFHYPTYLGEAVLRRHIGMNNRLKKYPMIRIMKDMITGMSRKDFDYITDEEILSGLASYVAASEDVDSIVITQSVSLPGREYWLSRDSVDDSLIKLVISAGADEMLRQSVEYVISGQLTKDDVDLSILEL